MKRLLRLSGWILLLGLLAPPVWAATAESGAADGMAGEDPAEIDPYEAIPLPVGEELDRPLLDLWKFVAGGGDLQQARIQMQAYLRSPVGKQRAEAGQLANSYMFHLLLGKLSLLGLSTLHEQPQETEQNKGLQWFSQGVERISSRQSGQGESSFIKGIFSVANLGKEEIQRLEQAGIKIRYWPSMNRYSNAAFIAGQFEKLTLKEKETVLNVAVGARFNGAKVDALQIHDVQSDTYMLRSLYFNLAGYIHLAGNNDYFAKTLFTNQSDDLYLRLKEKTGFDALQLFQQ